MFKFITNRPFWLNFLTAIILGMIIVFSTLKLLDIITSHGEFYIVPSVTQKETSAAIKILEDKGFDVEIIDSVYTDTARRGIVLKQYPEPYSSVKKNRTILLTVNRVVLPLVNMPSLEGKSLTFALFVLERSHLKLGDTIYKPDFMRGSVLEQSFRGDKILPGAKLPWGSSVDLVIGSGLNQEPVLVPDLTGLTYEEAQIILQQNGIIVGAVIPDAGIIDTAAAFIWKQSPPPINEEKIPVKIQPGQLLDIWISPMPKKDSSQLIQ